MKKVVIIGAGPAGLTAAYELISRSNEYEITVLEASDRIGGISQTVNCNGNRMDIGGHRFFSKNLQVVKWWNKILPTQGAPAYDDKKLGRDKPLASHGPDPEVEDGVMLIRDRVSRIYFSEKFFDYPISLKPDTIKSLGFVLTIKAGFSYLKSKVYKKPETNLENFYINRFGKMLYSMFFENYTEKLWGRHPREISADWGAQRVKGLSISVILKDIFTKFFHVNETNKETSLIEQFIYPKYGPGQLWEVVAHEAEKLGVSFKMLSPVTKLTKIDGRISSVKYYDTSEKSIDADIIISTMPLCDLVMATCPQLENIKEIAKGLPYRDFVTVGILVDRLILKNLTHKKTLSNIVPDCWIYIQDPKINMGRIQIFNNWSPYMVKDPDNTVWIGTEYFCTEGDEFWSMDSDDIVKFAVDELVKMDIINKDNVKYSHCEKIKKAYPAYFDTYSKVNKLIDYINNFGNVYCIGRNGQHRYNNMDHSMLTAFKAVDCILNGNIDKSDIWNVNSDAEYHEEKNTSIFEPNVQEEVG